jgi:GNAT superfamily N-acetyltransferase
MTPTITPATFPADLETIRTLFREYAATLNIDLAFQDFENELATLPGKYAPPSGRLFLASLNGEPVACIALRPINADTTTGTDCEMKRLYVRPQARGHHLGRRLAELIISEARAIGYRRILLDTLSHMTPARTLYTSLGFLPIDPYIYNPIPGALFMARDL